MNNKIALFSELVENKLYDYFSKCKDEYKIIFDSMEYSVKNGGKRVRPLLTLLFCDVCGGDINNAIPAAVALEYIHTYSLIHDDLPSLDNDDFRRGKPSNHKVYGEAVALLAGDGLLTAAFEVVSKGFEDGMYTADTAIKIVKTLSELAGPSSMIGGQIIDLLNENNPNATIEVLKLLDKLKTGALIECACVMGCIVAGADEDKIDVARNFAQKIGLAFQIKDDILDVTSSLEQLGKPTGSDTENGKSTYVSLLGIEKCETLVIELTNEAMALLENFDNNEALKEYADFLSKRDK